MVNIIKTMFQYKMISMHVFYYTTVLYNYASFQWLQSSGPVASPEQAAETWHSEQSRGQMEFAFWRSMSGLKRQICLL